MDDISFDMLAASLRQYGSDLSTFLEVLSQKLEESLPNAVQVERSGSLFSRTHAVRRLTVTLGDQAFELEKRGSSLNARIAHVVRGIALKTDMCTLPDWIEKLASALAEAAERDQAARDALRGWLIG